VESWRDTTTTLRVIKAIPSTHRAIKRARPHTDDGPLRICTNQGGIYVFIRSCLQFNADAFPEHMASKWLVLSIEHGVLPLKFFVIYRPGSAAVIYKFLELLKHCLIFSKSLCAGNVKIHKDDNA
jgi:hypothetical protein